MTEPVIIPTGRLVILWGNGTAAVVENMPQTLASAIIRELSCGRWASWSHELQTGTINPRHVADITFTLNPEPPAK